MYGLLKETDDRKTDGEAQVISTVIQQAFERTAHMVPFHETLSFVGSFIDDNLPNVDTTALTAFGNLIFKKGYMDVAFLGDDDEYEYLSDPDDFDKEFDVEKDPETGDLYAVRKTRMPKAKSDEEMDGDLESLMQRLFLLAQVVNSLRESSSTDDKEPSKSGGH